MLLCKRKRGKGNVVTKYKVRNVLCGNQMTASAKRGESKTTTGFFTYSPAVRHDSLKHCLAVEVLHDMRQRDLLLLASALLRSD